MSPDPSTTSTTIETAADAGAEGGLDLNALINSAFGLIGVAVGGILQWWLSERTAIREANAKAAAAQKDEEDRRDQGNYIRAFPSLKVALHLESYAHACAETISGLDDEFATQHRLPAFMDWPSDVVWAHLGANTEAKARDFAKSVELERSYLNGDLQESFDDHDSETILRKAVGRIGFRAWTMAVGLRVDAGLPAFEFPEHGWNYAEMLERSAGLGVAAPTLIEP